MSHSLSKSVNLGFADSSSASSLLHGMCVSKAVALTPARRGSSRISQNPTDPPRGSVTVLVVNMHGTDHAAFDELRRQHEGITPGVEFATISDDNVDGFGRYVNPIGNGRPLQNRRGANRKSIPNAKVGCLRFFCGRKNV